MYINLKTLEICSEHDVRAQNPLTTFPVPFALPDGYATVIPQPIPDFDKTTQAVKQAPPTQNDQGLWEQRWAVLELTPQQVSERELAKADAEAKTVADKIEALWAAADRYTSGYISGVAIGILTIGVMQQKPKAMAVSAWSSSIWTEYYARKALVTATGTDDHDFSGFGPIPYSVPELQAEVGV
jgi:hypothetical protein